MRFSISQSIATLGAMLVHLQWKLYHLADLETLDDRVEEADGGVKARHRKPGTLRSQYRRKQFLSRIKRGSSFALFLATHFGDISCNNQNF